MHEQLREEVCRANLELVSYGLVVFTWGNVSGVDRDAGVVAIKPSGVAYDSLTADKIVLLDLDGNVLEGDLNPSSDTPTHLELYRRFDEIAGVCLEHKDLRLHFGEIGDFAERSAPRAQPTGRAAACYGPPCS